MGPLLKILLFCSFVGVAVLIGLLISFYLRPLAAFVWFRRFALLRSGLQKARIATSVGKQTVWYGGSGPLLVLLHGAGDQAGTWNRVVPELKPRFRLLIPDLAGHGESEPFSGVLHLATLLTALEQVLDAEPWRGQSVLLVGNSLGAWMAMLYAEKHTDRVTDIILVDGGPIKNPAEVGIMPKDREEARRTLAAAFDSSTPMPANFVLDDLVRVANSGPISRLIAAGVEDISKHLLEDKLSSFPLRVALIWGASDRLVPLDYAKKLQSLLPNSTLTTIERCGHAPQLERPREFARVLLQTLAAGPHREALSEPSVPVDTGEHS